MVALLMPLRGDDDDDDYDYDDDDDDYDDDDDDEKSGKLIAGLIWSDV